MKDIKRKLNKKLSIVIIILIVSLVSFLGTFGMRVTPLGALKANPFTKDIIEVLADIDVQGGKAYIVDTPDAFRTAYVEDKGLFWVSKWSLFTEKEQVKNDKIKMIGTMSYSKSAQQQIQVLGIWNEDPSVKVIQITREDGMIYTQPAPINELILFQWDQVDNLNSISILALDKKGNPIYYYGYPEGTNIFRDSELKWHPVIESK